MKPVHKQGSAKNCASGVGCLRVTAAALLLSLAGAAQAQAQQPLALSLGAAASYSGFFFGNVQAAADVEGRLAVGGNLTAGFDIGYRTPYGSTSPSLVVAGDVSWHAGTLYAGPSYATDTNASIGPAAAQWLSAYNPQTGGYQVQAGSAVYGGQANLSGYWAAESFSQQAGVVDFNSARAQLTQLSNQLAALSANGTWVDNGGGITLRGDGVSTLQVFNLGEANLANLRLENVPAGAHIVINSSRTSVNFSGHLGSLAAQVSDLGDLGAFRDRLIFNLPLALTADVSTGLNGTVLAVQAAVTGSGHLEGTLVADSLQRRSDGAVLELGYEPFTATLSATQVTAVPEPERAVMMVLGLLGVALVRSRRRGLSAD